MEGNYTEIIKEYNKEEMSIRGNYDTKELLAESQSAFMNDKKLEKKLFDLMTILNKGLK